MVNSTNTIGSGTVAGAVQYLDFLSNKGHLTSGSVSAMRTGFTKVTRTLGGEDWEKIEVRSIDIDEYMTRFANMTHGQYNAASLADYKSRVKKVVTWYLEFLSNPGWVPDVKTRTRIPKSVKSLETTPTVINEPTNISPAPQLPGIARENITTLSKLIAFTLPLTDGTLVNLYLPPVLNKQDAKRVARFVEMLVIEEDSEG